MEMQHIQQVRKYLDIAVRRKVFIGMFLLAGIALGLVFYLNQPKIYQSTALLSYQQQKVSPAKMSPDDQARIQDIVSTLSQIIISRTSLEQIITDIGLYQQQRKNAPMEDIVENMRENINIQPSRRGDTFSITFKGSNPQKVARVANTLAAKFIEENLKYRQERASETFSYTDNELSMAKEILDRKEATLRDYKLKYYNEMPDQRENNMERLNALQEQYQNRQNSIQDLKRTRVLMQEQIAARKQIIEKNEQLRRALLRSEASEATPNETPAARLARLKGKLQSLLQRYTERHPEVRLLNREIASLEERVGENFQQGGTTPWQGNAASQVKLSENLFDLQVQLKELTISIKRQEEEKENLKNMIEKYEAWVEAAPVREAEWSSITREYSELKRHYDYLVSQNLQARSALNLERKQKGSQFKIEDPARQAQDPVKPDFLRIMAVAMVAGAGLGCALAFGQALIDSSFKDPAELEQFLEIDLICTVPLMALQKEKRRGMIISVLWGAIFIICLALLLSAIVYFWQQGKIIL
ncbi:MAG TPA: hypothetical protein VJ969_09405 [Desulfopila sp.]|nr:hypothetical protein [Desulfopila sp.]